MNLTGREIVGNLQSLEELQDQNTYTRGEICS